MCSVAGGKRAGARRAQRSGGNALTRLGHALVITVCVVAWGYLVFVAIEFGSAARHGDSGGWWFLLLATIGAVACLFAGILAGSRLLHSLGALPGPVSQPTAGPMPRPAGTRGASSTSSETVDASALPTPRRPAGHRALR